MPMLCLCVEHGAPWRWGTAPTRLHERDRTWPGPLGQTAPTDSPHTCPSLPRANSTCRELAGEVLHGAGKFASLQVLQVSVASPTLLPGSLLFRSGKHAQTEPTLRRLLLSRKFNSVTAAGSQELPGKSRGPQFGFPSRLLRFCRWSATGWRTREVFFHGWESRSANSFSYGVLTH